MSFPSECLKRWYPLDIFSVALHRVVLLTGADVRLCLKTFPKSQIRREVSFHAIEIQQYNYFGKILVHLLHLKQPRI